MNRQSGMTMIELMVSLAIVMLIIAAATMAYLKLLRTYRTQGRLAESYMANLTGLELLRYDIEMAGFGLPANMNGVNYTEATAGPGNTAASPYNPALLNDSTNNANGNNDVPRAFAHMDSPPFPVANYAASDVLSIKSSAANINPASKKWSMITNVNASKPIVKCWGGANLDPVMDFTNTPTYSPNPDTFIALDNNGNLLNNTGVWLNSFNGSSPSQGFYKNASSITGCNSSTSPNGGQVYYIYGLDNNTGAHIMPFNRVDYYLASNPNAPSSCAPYTLSLYRSTLIQTGPNAGTFNATPVIDCVRDFQVAFGILPDPTGYGNTPGISVQWQTNLLQNTIYAAGIGGTVNNAQMTAAQIQEFLREVRVFVLYSEGLGDTSASPSGSINPNSNFRFAGTLTLGDTDTGQLSTPFTPTGAQQQYRWKVIEIAVKPNNLLNLPGGTLR
jgi:type II secretory pathway component PulJ